MSDTPEVLDHPQETFVHAFWAIIYRQFIAFIVIWLAAGIPVTCQQHGVMTFFDVAHHTSPKSETEPDLCTKGNHESAPRTTLTGGGIGLIPEQLNLWASDASISLLDAGTLFPLLPPVPVPEQPPRDLA